MKTLTTEQWVEKARKVHGSTFNYSKAVYKNSKTPVDIICETHGLFTQQAGSHLRGTGCRKCGGTFGSLDTFLAASKKVHGDRYTYEDVVYKNNTTDVKITCKIHNTFLQAPKLHKKGHGCHLCNSGVALTTSQWVEKAKAARGEGFRYSDVEYVNSKTPIVVRCPEGHKFSVTPSRFLDGASCSVCRLPRSEKIQGYTSKFQQKFLEVFKDRGDGPEITCSDGHRIFSSIQDLRFNLKKFKCSSCTEAYAAAKEEIKAYAKKRSLVDFLEVYKASHPKSTLIFSRSEYISSDKPMLVTCEKGHEFKATPNNLLSKGSQCLGCSGSKQPTTSEFITRCVETHSEAYDYSLVTYKGNLPKVTIICPTHGKFRQRAGEHVRGSVCPDCEGSKKLTQEAAIKRFQDTHGNRYDYSEVVYQSSVKKVDIRCETHGWFRQIPGDHWAGHGCSKCGVTFSQGEERIKELIVSLGLEMVQGCRQTIKPFELDLVIPGKKIAIEFNGLYWHSEAQGKGSKYHRNKTDMCSKAGYRLIHIWEDDFKENPERELKFIRHVLGFSEGKSIYARRTTLREIPKQKAREFLDENHVQGRCRSTLSLGAFYKGDLVAVTCFLLDSGGWQLLRHAASCKVVGSLGKASKWFSVNKKEPVYTFCDISRFNGKSYEAAGFVKSGEIPPDYRYVVGLKRCHKFGFRKESIKKKYPGVYCVSKTEKEMMEEAGISRVWDCGKTRYERPC